MKNILFLFVFACFSLFFAQRSDAQCYVRLEDASGFNTDAYQDTLQAAAAKLCAIFDTTGFAGQFKVYDFGFYLHQENTTGGYPEPFAQKMSEVQALSPYYLLFGKQTDKSGVYTRFWVDLVLPDTGKFGCINLISPGYREHITDKFRVMSNEIYERSGQYSSKYAEAENILMDSLRYFFIDMMDCCDLNRQNRGGVCGECLISEFQFEKLLYDEGFAKTDCIIIGDVNSAETATDKVNLFVTIQGVTVNVDNEITQYISAYKIGHPGALTKIYTFEFPDICLEFNSLLAMAEADANIYGLVIVVGILGNKGEGGKVFSKTYEILEANIPANGPGYVYIFSEHGLFRKQMVGSQYHGIFFNPISTCFLINFRNNETCGDILARNSLFYISDENITFLRQMQKQCDAESREFGGVVGLNGPKLTFYECVECPHTATTLSANKLLQIDQYPPSSFIAVWHTHPSDEDDSQLPSGLISGLLGDLSGDMFIYNNITEWHEQELYIGVMGELTHNVWQLPGGIGLIAGDKGITIYRHVGRYYKPSSNVDACNNLLSGNDGIWCYETDGIVTNQDLHYKWVKYDLSTCGP